MLKLPAAASSSHVCNVTRRTVANSQLRTYRAIGTKRLRVYPIKPPEGADKDQEKKDNGERTISLLEELFGTSTQGKAKKLLDKAEREIPKIALDYLLPTSVSDEGPEDYLGRRNLFEKQRQKKGIVVLTLRGASKHLIESDFRRAIPVSKNRGWTRVGDILKVIRCRDPKTLEPDGSYYLLFADTHSALAYKSHAELLHRAFKTHLPGGLSGPAKELTHIPVPLPPVLDPQTGNVTSNINETYTLLPASHDLDLILGIEPFHPLLREIVKYNGYKALVEGRRSDAEVLLSVDWGYVHISLLSRAIARDGKERGLHWACISHKTAIRELTAKELAANWPSKFKTSEDDAEYAASLEAVGPPRNDSKRRFIISFKKGEEAKRFVMAWHRRDIAGLLESVPPHRPKVMANVELIW